jgi:hypothetical protein
MENNYQNAQRYIYNGKDYSITIFENARKMYWLWLLGLCSDKHDQGTLTEGDGSVLLTSLY